MRPRVKRANRNPWYDKMSIGEISTKDEFIKDNQRPLRQWPTVDFQ